MLSYIFMSTYKSLVCFHPFIISNWDTQRSVAIHELGNPARLAPEAFSTVPMYFTVKTNKHSLQTFITILGTVSALQEKLARSELLSTVGAKVSGGWRQVFQTPSQWRESWVREDAWTSGTALKGFREGGPVGNAWTLSNWLHFRPPRPRKHSKGSPEGTYLYGDLLSCSQGLGCRPRLGRAISVPTRRR